MPKTLLFSFLFLLSFAGFSVNGANFKYESETLKIQKLAKGIYLHKSYLETESWGKVGCNGMVYMNGKEAIVFDTPTNDKASEELISWIENKKKKNIKYVIVTHFHEDCLGGLKAFNDREIESLCHFKTMWKLMSENSPTLPKVSFQKDSWTLTVGNEQVILSFFGEGHTTDNIVAYIPSERALFGGCLIKSVEASKGYLGDANVASWSQTVEKIKKEWPELEVVVPGHGKSGGMELLDYTIELFKEN